MPAPSTPVPDWATNANHAAGSDPWSGQPTKAAPGAGVYATGFIPDQRPPAEWINYMFNLYGDWIQWFDDWQTGEGATRTIEIAPSSFTPNLFTALGADAWTVTSQVRLASQYDGAVAHLDLRQAGVPSGATNLSIDALITPGAARTGANNPGVFLYEAATDWSTPATPTVTTRDSGYHSDASTAIEVVNVAWASALDFSASAWTLALVAGSDGGSHNTDTFHSVRIRFTDAGPRNY